jgi:hypothetical protein
MEKSIGTFAPYYAPDVDPAMSALHFVGLFVFWYAFIRSIGQSSSYGTVITLSMIYNVINFFLVPTKFGFTYVQTILLMTASLFAITSPKRKYYVAEAFLVNLPVGLVSWVEAIGCDAFLVKFGGHLWYDMSIPISFCLFLTYVALQESSKKTKQD